jgi:hypothetical protein
VPHLRRAQHAGRPRAAVLGLQHVAHAAGPHKGLEAPHRLLFRWGRRPHERRGARHGGLLCRSRGARRGRGRGARRGAGAEAEQRREAVGAGPRQRRGERRVSGRGVLRAGFALLPREARAATGLGDVQGAAHALRGGTAVAAGRQGR